MAKICPHCGSLNDDDINVCTNCKNSMVSMADPSGSSTAPLAAPVPAGTVPGSDRLLKIYATGGIALVVIIAVLLFLANDGMYGILSSATPPVSADTTITPVLTGGYRLEPPEPEPTTIPIMNTSPASPLPDTSRTAPSTTKALVCPSDRRACGAACTDIMTDAGNCGSCGNFCRPQESCVQGKCMEACTGGQAPCFDGCHDLFYDSQNCGICGNACQGGLVCNKSVCSPPLATVIPTYEG